MVFKRTGKKIMAKKGSCGRKPRVGKAGDPKPRRRRR